MLFETRRLYLRELVPTDARHFYELNADPDVIRFTGDPPFPSVDAAEQFLLQYDQYTKYGYGRWAVVLKASDEWIGWCGLKFSEDLQETDLGFRFFRRYWGRGYATEAARACIDYGFRELQLKKIVGRAMTANLASVRVMEKAGMHCIGEREFERHAGVLYEITAAGYASLSPISPDK